MIGSDYLFNDDFQGDLTFFTNGEYDNLKDRFVKILNSNTKYFDVLVGYFRTSGFHELYESIQKVEKTRILVGINVDYATYQNLKKSKDFLASISNEKLITDSFKTELLEEINTSEDTAHLDKSVKSFIQLLVNERIEMKVYPHSPLHAKVYIMRKDREKIPDTYGTVITGSSNFSHSGLINNLEFNVELKDARDVSFALARFEELWDQGVEISHQYIDTIQNNSWLNEKKYTTNHLFYKVLLDYFEAEIAEDDINYYLPSNYKALQYQEDAVRRAKEIIEAYNGVFISDVVGLGKTYICAMLAQILEPGKKLILSPPGLVDYWKQVFLEFNVSVTVESIGKLDSIINSNHQQYKYVFIDEAHRFRNQNTESYQKLHQICFNKKIVLISATPQNNKIDDLANLIYLFQHKNNSNIIPNTKNIEKYFNNLKKIKKELTHSQDQDSLVQISKEIQDKVLRNIMIRRTRGEIQKYYSEDLKAQNLEFPTVESPAKLTYILDENLDLLFNKTINLIKSLKYSRYKPLLYLKDSEKLSISPLLTGQQNLAGFMKALLIKRLESSFYAFKQTIQRFVRSYEYAKNMLDDNAFYIGEEINVYDLFANDREDQLIDLLTAGRVSVFLQKDFNTSFNSDLLDDLNILREVDNLWSNVESDPKLKTLISTLRNFEQLSCYGKKIIFSESSETVDYLTKKLTESGFKCLSFTGSDSHLQRKVVEQNFNPSINKNSQKNDFEILITSDVLAEGINLHRANVIFNYDLPWNPTKIMQRVGRINRVGTIFNQIYIYNFFPTDQSQKHLSLEENISNKIQAFHDLLGEDYKYLTESENVSSHGIFGKNLLKKIDGILEEGEQVNNSELKYLQMIRQLKDSDINFFNEIEKMPYKVRCGITSSENFLLTYVRQKSLKKFFINNEQIEEIPFITAASIFESYTTSLNRGLSKDYFIKLDENINLFNQLLKESNAILNKGTVRNPNDLKVISILKTLLKMNPDRKESLTKYIQIWHAGVVPKMLTNKIINLLKNEKNTQKIMAEIDELIPEVYLEYNKNTPITDSVDTTEVVLSLNGRMV